jgi:hypothetical protein
MSLHYAWEKFLSATLTLAQAHGPVTDRVALAFESALSRLKSGGPSGLETKPKLQERFDAMFAKMTAHGSFRQSSAALGETEAYVIAGEIVDIFNDLAREVGAEDERSIPKRQ